MRLATLGEHDLGRVREVASEAVSLPQLILLFVALGLRPALPDGHEPVQRCPADGRDQIMAWNDHHHHHRRIDLSVGSILGLAGLMGTIGDGGRASIVTGVGVGIVTGLHMRVPSTADDHAAKIAPFHRDARTLGYTVV